MLVVIYALHTKAPPRVDDSVFLTVGLVSNDVMRRLEVGYCHRYGTLVAHATDVGEYSYHRYGT